MSRCVILCALSLGAACLQPAMGQNFQVPAELWDRPRSGKAVMGTANLRQALTALLANPQAKLALRHPPGAEAMLQAEELRAWLIAHAVEPGRIVLAADLPARQPLQLEVVRP